MLVVAALVGAMAAEPCSVPTLPERVSQRLSTLQVALPAELQAGLRFDDAPARLRIELRSPAGGLLSSRTLPDPGSCEDRVVAAAAVISAWQTHLSTVTLPDPPRLHAEPGGPPPATAARSEGRTEAALALGLMRSGDSTALAGRLEGTRAWGRVTVLLSLLGQTEHASPLGPGVAAWMRPGMALGLAWRLHDGATTVDLGGEGVLGVLVAQGIGYTPSSTEIDVEPGLGGGLRLGRRIGRLRPFLDLRADFWLRRQELNVRGLADTLELPHFELALLAGAAIGGAR
jgi:hypothetical protein